MFYWDSSLTQEEMLASPPQSPHVSLGSLLISIFLSKLNTRLRNQIGNVIETFTCTNV